MADVFSRTEVNFGGSMTSQFGLLVPIPGVLTGVLMQNLQLSYRQGVTRVYEIGAAGAPTRIYYVGGRAQGDMAAAHILGPGLTILNFYNRFSDVCAARTNSLTLRLGPNVCDTQAANNSQLTYTAKYCVMTQLGIAAGAQEFVINESSSLMFSGLEMRDSSSAAVLAGGGQAANAAAGAIVGAAGNIGNALVNGIANIAR